MTKIVIEEDDQYVRIKSLVINSTKKYSRNIGTYTATFVQSFNEVH